MVLPPLKYTCTPYFRHVLFEAFTQPFIVWHHYVRILFLVASHTALVLLLVFVG